MRIWVRILSATLFMLLALTATAALGAWQYSNSQREDIIDQVLAADPVEIGSIHTLGEYVPESRYGQLVKLRGFLDCRQDVIVTTIESQPDWQVCPLQLNDTTKVAIVVSAGGVTDFFTEVSLVGRLQPAQDTSQLSAMYEPTDSVEFMNTDELVLRWQSDVLDGYVAVEAMSIANSEKVIVIKPVLDRGALVLPPVGIELRNLFYAWQWWIFAGFAVFLWAKFVRDEWLSRSLEASQGMAHQDDAG